MRTTNRIVTLITGFLFIASAGMYMAHTARAAVEPTNAGPTKENALEVERELGRAMLNPLSAILRKSRRSRVRGQQSGSPRSNGAPGLSR
jgi:hypothetical protein